MIFCIVFEIFRTRGSVGLDSEEEDDDAAFSLLSDMHALLSGASGGTAGREGAVDEDSDSMEDPSAARARRQSQDLLDLNRAILLSLQGDANRTNTDTSGSINSNFDEASIASLTAMGFERSQVLVALHASKGNVDEAADFLIMGST
jgi:hypothetical protein